MPRPGTYLKLLGAVLAWGGTFLAAKFATLDSSVEMAALLRFITASLALLLILYLRQGYLPRLNARQLYYVVLLGLTGVAFYNLFFFFGLQTVEAGRGALIITSNPIWVIPSSWLAISSAALKEPKPSSSVCSAEGSVTQVSPSTTN